MGPATVDGDEHGDGDVQRGGRFDDGTAMASVRFIRWDDRHQRASVKTTGTQDYDNVVITPAATLTTTNSNVSIHGTSLCLTRAGLSSQRRDGGKPRRSRATVNSPGSFVDGDEHGDDDVRAAAGRFDDGPSRASRSPAGRPTSTAGA